MTDYAGLDPLNGHQSRHWAPGDLGLRLQGLQSRQRAPWPRRQSVPPEPPWFLETYLPFLFIPLEATTVASFFARSCFSLTFDPLAEPGVELILASYSAIQMFHMHPGTQCLRDM